MNKANIVLMDFCSKNPARASLGCIQVENNRAIASDGAIIGIVTRPKTDKGYPKYQYVFKGQGKTLSSGKFSVKHLKKIIKLCEALKTNEIKIKMYADNMICLASNKVTEQKAIVKLMKLEEK